MSIVYGEGIGVALRIWYRFDGHTGGNVSGTVYMLQYIGCASRIENIGTPVVPVC